MFKRKEKQEPKKCGICKSLGSKENPVTQLFGNTPFCNECFERALQMAYDKKKEE